MVGRSRAEVDMQCAYCFESSGELNIKASQDYFFIQGHRTYDRISRGNAITGSVNEFIPYIPRNFLEKLANPRINSKKFQDRIRQHRMCHECYRKLFRFFHGELFFPSSRTQRLSVITRHTMRIYTSMPDREYVCQCCDVHIPSSTVYGRRGHHDKICRCCLKLLAKYIGEEFSY
ncbi:MAG: hypothetical protein ACD_56C00167G0005 [uncultured bacterium]|nr:MAG: hypothetical protein ACD_56C00167G0005 [uncultured bacterium]